MMTRPNTPPHRLDLKVNIQRNIFVEVQIPHTGEIHCLPHITFSFSPACSSWTVDCKQFPLRSAYATTFNGSEGLTLEKASLGLHTDSFANGQVYTSIFKSTMPPRHSSAISKRRGKDYHKCTNISYYNSR
ncbi:hypothetical protein BDR06DRAFT_935175 [Suillus hirtellus]|nr:hypothetical protein BDR06DRAFT_935175 [Suillus hirtellus]